MAPVRRCVLVERRPAGRVLDRAETGQDVVTLDGQLGDVLLHTHGELQYLA